MDGLHSLPCGYSQSVTGHGRQQARPAFICGTCAQKRPPTSARISYPSNNPGEYGRIVLHPLSPNWASSKNGAGQNPRSGDDSVAFAIPALSVCVLGLEPVQNCPEYNMEIDVGYPQGKVVELVVILIHARDETTGGGKG